jgi:hypothetical protein
MKPIAENEGWIFVYENLVGSMSNLFIRSQVYNGEGNIFHFKL